VANDSADVTSSGRLFQVCGPATGKARLPTVNCLLIGNTRRLVTTEQLGWSTTGLKGPRYPGASTWTTLYVNMAILELSQGRAANGGRAARRRCGRFASGDRSTVQSPNQVDRKARQDAVAIVQMS